MLTYISITLILLSFLLAAVLLFKRNNKTYLAKSSAFSAAVKKKRNTRIYEVMANVYPFSELLSHIRKNLKLSVDTEKRKNTELSILLKSLILSLLFAVFMFPFVLSVHVLIASIITLYFILISSADFFTAVQKTKILSCFIDFLDLFTTKYFESKSEVEVALFDTIQLMDSDKYANFIDEMNYILDIISSANSNLALRDYYQVAPNNYFKLFSGILAISKESGDSCDERGSRLTKAISDLSGEIKDEIMLRRKLSYSLRSLNIIAVIPLLTLNPIKAWASGSFYPIQKFFESGQGLLTEFTVLFSIVFANYMLSRIRAFDTEHVAKSEILHRSKMPKFYSRIVNYLVPQRGSRHYSKVDAAKKRAFDYSSMEDFYRKKLNLAVLVFICLITLSIYSNLVNQNAILNSPVAPKGYLGGELSGKELEQAKIRSDKDEKIIKALLETEHKEGSAEKIVEMIKSEYGDEDETVKTVTERIISKTKSYKANNFSLVDLLFSYVFAVLAFFIPNIALFFREKLLKLDSMSEVNKFQLICLMFNSIKKIEIIDILYWMQMLSTIYREALQRAIMDYDSGQEEALHALKDSVDEDEFKKLIERMISAVTNLSIEMAFKDLEMEKKYFEARRREMYEDIILKKSSYGRFAGFIPCYSVIFLYFMFPIIWSGLNEIELYFSMMSL